MKGGIYSDQRCRLCGGAFHDNGRNALVCQEHPDEKATSFRVLFRGVHKRFKSYDEASRFLTGVRFETDQGNFDDRDYRREKPLAFSTLANQFLKIKEAEVKRKSYINIRNAINRAVDRWGERNIKTIGYADLEDLLNSFRGHLSDKSRANMKSALHSFFAWLKRRRVIQELPEFPSVPFQMAFRRTIDLDLQSAIVDEIYNLTKDTNPRIWLAVKMLSTYIAIRPGELIRAREEHFDLKNGVLFVPDPKEKKPKNIPLLEEDVEIIRAFPRGLPGMFFFRHSAGIKGIQAGQPFGPRLLYKYWTKACENLGVEGVDLYGGTKHSTARALRHRFSPEQIKRATMHSTNKAFDRYFSMELDDIRQVYAGKELAKKKGGSEKAKILKFKE